MKKSVLLSFLFIFILSTTCLFAQPEWQWGQEVRWDAGSIAVDNYGNSYVSWTLQDPYEIDGTLFISNGFADAALTSFDCDGAHRWTKIIGGSSNDEPWGLGADTLGGVYIALNVNSTRLPNYSINLSTDTTINAGQKGMLLVKYNTDGNLQWIRMPEDTVIFNFPDDLQIGSVLDMDVTSNGDCFIYSRLFPGTYGEGTFEATYASSLQPGREDIYTLIYDSDGNCTDGIHIDMWYDASLPVKTNFMRDPHTGKYYMSGYLSGNDVFIFGGEEVNANNFVVQFDSEGFVNWRVSTDDVNSYGTRFYGKPSVDVFENVYVTGGTQNGNSFGDFSFQNNLNSAGFPIFAKIDPLGNVVYATNASENVSCRGTATSYSNNEVAVTGYWGSLLSWGEIVIDSTSGDSQGYNVFLALFDPSGDGMPESFQSLTSSPMGVEEPSLLTSDRQGNFYVGGNFSGQLHVGDGTLYNQYGTQEGFIAKFGTDSCYCPLPEALFAYDSIPNQAGYNFAYTGSTDADSVTWDFGDGQTGSGFNTYHFFAESGDYTVCATAYNNCGTDTVCLTIPLLGPVGLRGISQIENIRLYPNPAREMLYIEHDVPGSRVHVINAVGQLVLSTTLPAGAAQVDVSKLPAGLYILRVSGSAGGYARFAKE